MNLRLNNDKLARILHQPLYDRMFKFCEEYTPEIPADVVVTSWLTRLYQGDNRLHVLVTLEDGSYTIKGHAVVDVQSSHGYNVVHCYQAQADKGYTSTLAEGIEYVDKLVDLVQAHCAIFVVTKHMKGFEKKYGYQATRTMMVKYREGNDEK